jgi:hypothetical protein
MSIRDRQVTDHPAPEDVETASVVHGTPAPR